jgi:hypothetical protein
LGGIVIGGEGGEAVPLDIEEGDVCEEVGEGLETIEDRS